MNTPKEIKDDSETQLVSPEIQFLIEGVVFDDNWKQYLQGDESFNIIDDYFRNHSLLGHFYIGTLKINNNIKEDLCEFKKIRDLGFFKGQVISRNIKLGELDFDEGRISNIINFKHNSTGIFIDDFINKSKDGHSLHRFITLILISQLKNVKEDITEFVNQHLINGKLIIHGYRGFSKQFSSLNGKSEVSSIGQNHRLTAIALYNHYINKLGLVGIFDPVKYIHSSKIELHKREVHGEEIDDILSSNYIIDKEEIKDVLGESFDEITKISKLIEILGELNNAPSIAQYYLITQEDFNGIFDQYGEKFKTKILGFFNHKSAKQIFKDKIEQIMKDAQEGKFMNSKHSIIVDYGDKGKY